VYSPDGWRWGLGLFFAAVLVTGGALLWRRRHSLVAAEASPTRSA
jgi:hypothetical protein